MGTIFVLFVLLLIVGLAVYSLVRDKKNGKSIQCGGDCKYCGGHCHQVDPANGGKKRG